MQGPQAGLILGRRRVGYRGFCMSSLKDKGSRTSERARGETLTSNHRIGSVRAAAVVPAALSI